MRLNYVSDQIQIVRDQFVNATLITISILGIPPMIGSFFRAQGLGAPKLFVFQFICYAIVLSVTLLRRRSPFYLRCATVVLLVYLVGVSTLFSLGFLGGGIMFLFASVVLTAVLLGTRAGFSAIAIGAATIVSVGYMVTTGAVSLAVSAEGYMISSLHWNMKAATFSLLTLLVVTAIGSIHRRLVNTIDTLVQRTEDEQHAKHMLQKEIEYRERTEARLLQMQKMEAVGHLAGGVAHDFNNLLHAIRGYVDMALSDIPKGSQAHEDLTEATAAVDRAASLVKQLLTFSESKPTQPVVIDLRNIVDQHLKLLKPIIGRHISVNVNVLPNDGPVVLDPAQFEQILMNLCINARDAMPDGGSISIELGTVTPEEVPEESATGLKKAAHYLHLTVADNGEGIPDDVVEHIYEPFFTTKETGKGTGLGLATVYSLVDRNGGSISVDTEVGKGTTFEVYLPLGLTPVEPPQESNATTLPPSPLGGKETILIAEDDEHLRKLAVRVLEQAGYTLLVAADGERASALFHENADDIQLAVLDVIMPKKTGVDLYKEIQEKKAGLPVIFVTGHGFGILDRLDLSSNNHIVLPKPYNPTELLRRVRAAMERDPTSTGLSRP